MQWLRRLAERRAHPVCHLLRRPDPLGEIGCAFPQMANAALRSAPLRVWMEQTIGLSAKRSLPKYASERFDGWFARRSSRAKSRDPAEVTLKVSHRDPSAAKAFGARGDVILWDDTFVRYNEPHIGVAAVKGLGAPGVHV